MMYQIVRIWIRMTPVHAVALHDSFVTDLSYLSAALSTFQDYSVDLPSRYGM